MKKNINPAVHIGILVIAKYPFPLREGIKGERDIGLFQDGASLIIFFVRTP
jgi:hypothetical protein